MKSFDRVNAYATEGGYDRDYLYDSSRDDQLEAAGSSATLTRAGVSLFAEAFEWLKAISSERGTGTKDVGALDYLLETEGPRVDIRQKARKGDRGLGPACCANLGGQ